MNVAYPRLGSFLHPRPSERSSALNQVNDQDNDRNHEQQMDQSAANMGDEPEKPEHDQDYNYRPQHRFYFRLISFKRLCATPQQKDQKQMGMGIPSSQSRMYPVAPASLILFVRRILDCLFVILQTLKLRSKLFFRFAEFLLQTAEKLFILSFGECEVVIGQLPVFLFQLAFCFLPTAFES